MIRPLHGVANHSSNSSQTRKAWSMDTGATGRLQDTAKVWGKVLSEIVLSVAHNVSTVARRIDGTIVIDLWLLHSHKRLLRTLPLLLLSSSKWDGVMMSSYGRMDFPLLPTPANSGLP